MIWIVPASYRELVEGVFDAMGIQGNVNMNLVGFA